jgi:hypothetical protein
MPGGYDVQRWPDANNPSQIRFVVSGNNPPSASESALSGIIRGDVDKLARIAEPLFPSFVQNSTYKDCYERFYDAAQEGLQSPNGNIQRGRQALEDARQHAMLLLGRKARDRFVVRMIFTAGVELVLSAILILCVIIFWQFVDARPIIGDTTPAYSDRYTETHNMYTAMLFLAAPSYAVSLGLAGVGIFIAIVLANMWYLRDLTWERVDFLDPAGLHPAIRVFSVWLLTVLLMVLLANKVIIVGIMNVTLNEFVGNVGLSLLVGILCGLSEVPVVGLIQRAFSRPTVTPQPAATGTGAAPA